MNVIHLELEDAEVQQLRELMDALPLRPYITLIPKVLKALPMTDAEVTSPLSDSLAKVLRNRVPA